MDEARPNPSNGGTPQIAIPVHQGSGPALERGSLNPNAPKFGRRRRTRSSQSENQGSGAEDEWMGGSVGSANSYGQSPVLGGGSSGMLSSSPRSPGSRGSYVVRAGPSRPKQPNGRQQNIPRKDSPSRPVTTAKSPGTARRQASRGRNRTSSETERGGKGSRGPAHRKRGLLETECRPKWDNTNMSGVQCLAAETIWFDKQRYDDAETRFYEGPNGPSIQETEASAILQEIAKSRQNIQQCLDGAKTALQPAKARPQKRQHRNSSNAGGDHELISRMKSLELENQGLHKVVEDMRAALQKLESRVAVLEKSPATGTVPCAKAAPVQQAKVENGDDDDDDDDDNDDIDLFGSDEEADAAAERLKEKRLEEYAAKKAKKPALIAKSSILLDVKPWDDETDMAKLEECVRSVEADGLLWGASKLLPVGYGIKKLQINCVVEDDKVGTDMLEEEITKFEDYVQSVDVAAFNKI